MFFCLSHWTKATKLHSTSKNVILHSKDGKQFDQSKKVGSASAKMSLATRLKITGDAHQIAGTSQDITITALDDNGNVDESYSGSKIITFSGASMVSYFAEAVQGGVGNLIEFVPSANNKQFGQSFFLEFENGMAIASLILYKAEIAQISAQEELGIETLVNDRLTVTVTHNVINQFDLNINPIQYNRLPFSGTNLLTALDQYFNPVLDYNAETNPVEFRISNFTGKVSRSNGSQLLNLSTDFHQGVADLSTMGITFAGPISAIGSLIFQVVNNPSIIYGKPMVLYGGNPIKFELSGPISRLAGQFLTVSILAIDMDGNTSFLYGGTKNLTVETNASPTSNGLIPTLENSEFNKSVQIGFVEGRATFKAVFYKAEKVNIDAFDGNITSKSNAIPYSLMINPAPLNKFKTQLYSPQTSGETFIGENTVTALDAYDNVITNYNAGTTVNNVRVSTSLKGTISGLSGINILNRAGDFVNGVANLTRLGLKFTGREGVGTFTFTRTLNNITGTSNVITMYSGDMDHDGLLDTYEIGNNSELPKDTDMDGILDFVDKDSDNDSLLDSVESGGDMDHDGIPNFLDLDSDGDWLGDSDERDGDNDLDGKPNFLDDDSDNDGIPDTWEGKNKCVTCLSVQDDRGDGWDDRGQFVAIIDTDKDGQPDFLDQDSDNDQIPDRVELGADVDGDATPNFRDLDSDNDGIPDTLEAGNFEHPRDTDLDGLADFEDVDSDNDGLPDSLEVGPNPSKPLDTDQDGIPNYLDSDADGDGILDVWELGNTPLHPLDTDMDGLPDYLDLDSDGDGIPDAIEKGANTNPQDSDQDGTADFQDTDSDGDGILDKLEAGDNPLKPVDTDSDRLADILDLDSDNDAIADQIEVGENPLLPLDTDLDGIANYRDVDSDNDSIPDQIEVGQNPAHPVDTDADGMPDYQDLDSDNDGIPDLIEGNFIGKIPVDTDSDGKADYVDLDSDGDGIADFFEAGLNPTHPLDTDLDGIPNFQDVDSDADGILDKIEAGLNPSIPADFDADGIPNYIDLDSDNDSISDKIEAQPLISGPADTDHDGFADYLDLDSDNDKISDRIEVGKDSNNPVDTDHDGLPDYRDLDSDGDKIPDALEFGKNPLSPIDTDGDGKPDYQDTDSDNNGITDTEEVGPDPTNPLDTDTDGIYNYLDADDDGDGLLDKWENDLNLGALPDCDHDGIPNQLDPDVCETYLTNGFSPNGDGVNDTFIIPGIMSLPNHRLSIYNRWGSLVFETDNYKNNWDGMSNYADTLLTNDGKIVDGIYYYIIDFGTVRPMIQSYLYVNRMKNN